jgi:hypothetical protein
MIKKLALLVLFVAFVSAPALAGNIPEFDVVGDDSMNFFNDFVKDMVVDNNSQNGTLINFQSDWTGGVPVRNYVQIGDIPLYEMDEFFASSGARQNDHCFAGYESWLTGAIFPGIYQWLIVLQMAPESDIDLNMRDCVTKQNESNIWFYAQQTGRWRESGSGLRWNANLNPLVTVYAVPGPRHTFGFNTPFLLDARRVPTPNLAQKTLDGTVRFTSKALWEEGIVIELPTGGLGANQQQTYLLREGDMIFTQFFIPQNHPADVRYGVDNVSLKYIGIVGMFIHTGVQVPVN